jgi:hypothetical protein
MTRPSPQVDLALLPPLKPTAPIRVKPERPSHLPEVIERLDERGVRRDQFCGRCGLRLEVAGDESRMGHVPDPTLRARVWPLPLMTLGAATALATVDTAAAVGVLVGGGAVTVGATLALRRYTPAAGRLAALRRQDDPESSVRSRLEGLFRPWR